MTDAAAPMNPRGFSTPYTPVEPWFEPETPDQPGGGEGNNQDSSVTVATYSSAGLGVRFVPHRSAGAEGGGGPPQPTQDQKFDEDLDDVDEGDVDAFDDPAGAVHAASRPDCPDNPVDHDMADSEEEPEGAPGAEEDARTGLIDAYSDDDDERDEVISVTATIIDGDMSAEDGNDGSDDDDPDAEACPWSYLDLRRDFYAEGGVAAALSFHESHGDTTAAQAKAGRDIQGIPWDRLQFTREQYRTKRVQEYKNYANLEFSPADLDGFCTPLGTCPAREPYFEFAHNTRAVRSNFVHFQLRNLVWATSKHDAYVMSENRVVHWNAATRRATPVLDLDGGVSGGVMAGDFPRIQVSTTRVKDGIVAAGGFAGELVVLDTNTGASRSTRVTQDDNGITNAIEIFSARSGREILVSSNNDAMTRFYDVETMRCLAKHKYPWAVNYATASHCGRHMVVVGDSTEAWLVDVGTGRRMAVMEGHLDFSFAAAWHPNGCVFATGNQDTTTRLWDARYLGQSLAVLRGNMGAIRSLRFSDDGRFLAAAEPADFVHVYDGAAGFTTVQTMDHFGETAGIGFSPDCETLFVGVADLTYGSVLEYTRAGHGAAAVVV